MGKKKQQQRGDRIFPVCKRYSPTPFRPDALLFKRMKVKLVPGINLNILPSVSILTNDIAFFIRDSLVTGAMCDPSLFPGAQYKNQQNVHLYSYGIFNEAEFFNTEKYLKNLNIVSLFLTSFQSNTSMEVNFYQKRSCRTIDYQNASKTLATRSTSRTRQTRSMSLKLIWLEFFITLVSETHKPRGGECLESGEGCSAFFCVPAKFNRVSESEARVATMRCTSDTGES